MSRANAARAVLALVVIVVSGWLIAVRPARLGLDLRAVEIPQHVNELIPDDV